jgi:hypothetical protein
MPRIHRRASPWLIAVLLAPAASALAQGGAAADRPGAAVSSDPVFRVRLTDGSVVTGRIDRLATPGPLRLEGAEGRSIPLEGIVSLTREAEPPPGQPAGGMLVFPDGDRLRAIVGATKDGAVQVRPGPLGDSALSVPLDDLLGLVWAPAGEASAQEALLRRVRTEPRRSEVLWLTNGDRLVGSLLGFSAEAVEFQPDTGPLTLPRPSVVAIGFDPRLVRYGKPEGTYLELTLTDGSRLGVTDARVERGQLTARTRFGAEVRPPLSALSRIVVRSAAVAYLSERAEDGAQYVGYVGEHPKTYGRDATWDGHPLSLAGRPYDRGLGTLPRTLLAYRLDPADRRFQATIGLDDRAGELGSVVFRVLVDGKERWASPPVGRRGPPVDVDVDVAGGKVLILATEFGERGDVQDSADWIDARIVQ